MNDALKQLETLLGNAAATPQQFPPNSRYNGVAALTHETADGRTVAYLARRVVPAPDRFATLQTHTVVDGDRLDSLAAIYFGDVALWWRLADANGAVKPGELVDTPGEKVRITLPEGIPAGTDE